MTHFFYIVKKIKFKTVSLIPKRRFVHFTMVPTESDFIIKNLKVFLISYLLIFILLHAISYSVKCTSGFRKKHSSHPYFFFTEIYFCLLKKDDVEDYCSYEICKKWMK